MSMLKEFGKVALFVVILDILARPAAARLKIPFVGYQIPGLQA